MFLPKRSAIIAAEVMGAPSAEWTRPTVTVSGEGSSPPIEEGDALAGLGLERRLGRYTLLEVLGHGGMGVVFSAYDEELDRKVAIKFVRQAGGDARARAALLGEAQALARLAHPNVIHVYEVGEAGERVFLAMEFVRGPTLRAWLREPRGWPEVVAMFVQAGRGLAAAHEAGIVHCDFKPDNALIGPDDRVRVLDFGLARRTSEQASGVLVGPGGTPGYVPPEQYEGRPLDARSDQFSFCVALHEGLLGQRPFGGNTPVEVMAQVLRGEPRATPGEAKLPARLRRAIRRGLAVDPAARHPSMMALLAELTDALPRPRRAWWLAALASAALTSIVWAPLLRGADPAAACATEAAAEASALWGPEARAEIERAFAATGLPFAPDSFERVVRLLELRVEAWSAARRQTCQRGGDGPAARCVLRHRGELAAWIEALRGADAGTVEQAVAATAELSDPRACVDPRVLHDIDAQELAPERVVAIAGIERLLARGRAQERAGQYERAQTPVRAALRQAQAFGLRRLVAAARLRLGLLQEYTGDGGRAAEDLAAAFFVAESAGLPMLRAEAAIHLVHVTGGPPRAPEADALWSRLAESIADGLGEGALDLRASLLQHRSRAALGRGSPGEALIHLEAALALETRRLGPEHPALAAIHEQLGDALLALGRADATLEHHGRAFAVAEASLGPEHPDTARRILARAQAHEHRGDLRAALGDDLRALSVWERAHGEHARLIWPLTCAGRVLRKAGQLAEAEPHYARALAIAEQAHGPEHLETARAQIELGDVVRALGRIEEATAHHLRALEILRARAADAGTWQDLGEALLADGAAAPAVVALERALHGAAAPLELARVRFALARALWDAGDDRARSRALAEQARDALGDREEARAIDAWLAGRGDHRGGVTRM